MRISDWSSDVCSSDLSLNFRKNEARRNADWYQSQLELAKRALASAENARTKFAQENGIVVAEDGGPVLAQQQLGSTMAGASSARATVAQAGMAAVSTATAGEGIRAQIAQVDQQIATPAEQLGPTHPAMQARRGQRSEGRQGGKECVRRGRIRGG